MACPQIRRNPASLAVVALLLSVVSGVARGDNPIPALPPIAYFPPTVDSVVSKVNGPILDLFDGALQIDVTNAKVTGGDDRLANPLPWPLILPGSRVIAQVVVPDVIPAVFPPRLAATSVVVFLANSGNLSGMVQGIGLAQGTFSLDYVSVKTNAATEWSGTKADGTPVKGLSDLSLGMQANVSVVADASGVTARSVYASPRPSRASWRSAARSRSRARRCGRSTGRSCRSRPRRRSSATRGSGDVVDVLEKVQILPAGSAAPTTIPIAISIIKVGRAPEGSDVDSSESSRRSRRPRRAAGGPRPGHWTIWGRDVLDSARSRKSTPGSGRARASTSRARRFRCRSSAPAASNAPDRRDGDHEEIDRGSHTSFLPPRRAAWPADLFSAGVGWPHDEPHRLLPRGDRVS